MRNLKRVLALALALVMTLGLMITASAASYPDADQIDAKYTEAVEVLSGLGVFKGQGNGGTTSFAPKAVLTRGEAATLVYRILTGDVTDAQVRNYDYTSFEDVLEGQWWTGYITYSANGGYVKGYDGRFNPQDEVTGVQVLAIMLRAIGRGQNGEYEGAAWKDNVLTDARDLGLLKGIATDDLDKGAERQLVAQLLFNAITIPNIVTYSALLGYQVTPEKQTLGNKTFGLVRFDGVVTANEYADLYDTEPLTEGKTEIDGVTYSLSTDLTVIGESRQGWAYGKNKTVVYIEDTGDNTVFQTGAATKVNDAKFEKANGITDDTELFVNFGQGSTYTCDRLLTFGFLNEDGEIDEELQTVVKAGKPILNIDVLEEVFDDNNGYVYVGTKNTANGKDLSDTMSWKQFKAEYLEEDLSEEIKSTANGEWLKIIDNDGDGVADYVFKTWFVVDVVDAVTKNGIEIDAIVTKGANKNANEIVCNDDVAADDVVIWTIIDGVARVSLAESFTAEVKSYSWKNDEITTTDGDVYGQSGIINSDDGIYADLVYTDLEDAADKTDYIFYTDFFGYVAAFDEVETSNGLLLLTDGYYSYGLNKKDTYQIEYWNSEDESFDTAGVNTTASKSKDADENSITISDFIYDDDNASTDKNQGWERLIGAVDDAWTNVAAVSLADETATVKDVNAKSNKTVTYITGLDYTDGVKDDVDGFAAKDKTLTADNTAKTTVLTNSKTVFYYVYKNGKTMTVTEKVGYANSLEVLDSEARINAAYAVVTTTEEYYNSKTAYPVADVVVVEVNNPIGATKDTVLLYSVDVRTSGEVRSLSTIVDGASKTYQLTGNWSAAQYAALNNFTFQSLTMRNGKAEAATKVTNYPANNIYAGTINATNGIVTVEDGKYVLLTNGKTVEIDNDTPILTFSAGSRNTYEVSTENTLTAKNNGDEIIYVTDNKGNVTYVINVSKSVDKNKVILEDVQDLWEEIVSFRPVTVKTSYDKAKEAYDAAKAKVDAGEPLTAEEITNVTTLIGAAQADPKTTDVEQLALTAMETEANTWGAGNVRTATITARTPATYDDTTKTLTVPYSVDLDTANKNTIETYVDVSPDGNWKPGDECVYDADAKTFTITLVGENNAAANTIVLNVVNAPLAADTVATIGGTEYTSLGDAITAATSGNEIIVLQKDVALDARITIGAGITLDGNDYTITAPNYRNDSTTAANDKGAILLNGGTIKDLTVVGPNSYTGGNWDNGEYGIKIYADDSVLENVTVTGANAGIQVAADTTFKGTIDVSGNEFGGIEVKDQATLTIDADATLVNSTETHDAPTIWIDPTSTDAATDCGTVNGGDLQVVKVTVNGDEKVYFYVDTANTVAKA